MSGKELENANNTDNNGDQEINIEEIDVLDIINEPDDIGEDLGDSPGNSVAEKPKKGDSLEDFSDLEDLFSQGLLGDSYDSSGSGDVFQDIVNWLTDEEKLPSSPLVSYMSNFRVKLKYSIYFYHLVNLKRARNLLEYLEVAEKVIFDKDEIASTDTEELKGRYVQGVKTLNEITTQSRKVLHLLEKELKKDSDDSVDKLRILLGSLPSHKIKEMFKYLR